MLIHLSRKTFENCQSLTVASYRRVENLAVVALIFLNFIVGCSKSPSRLTPPDIDADAAAAALIEEYDMNKNSALDGEELDHIPAIKSALNKYDTNGDKQVSAEEIKSRIESWQIVPVASMPISCTVRLGRQPLANATIVLEPEKPFAGQLKRAIGKTDRGGFAQFSIQLDEESERSLNGVQCGLYKVRITAPLGDGRELPAKYNAKTKLGLEVAPDAAFMRSGLRFDL